jgi:hypothetical protein
MSLTSNDLGIPVPGDAGVESFLLVTVTEGQMFMSTNMSPDELDDLLDQIGIGLDEGAEFSAHMPVRPS